MKNLILICTIFTLFIGCKKYPEGPNISLKTAKSRITGEWTLKRVTVVGIEQYPNGNLSSWGVIKMDIKSDGSFDRSLKSGIEGGTWEFSDNKTIITFEPCCGWYASGTIYNINELRNKSMQLKCKDIDYIFYYEQ